MSGTAPTGPVVFRCRNLLIWAIGFSVLLVIACIVGWFALDPHIRVQFTWFQIATLIIIAGVLIGFMMGLGLSVVVADKNGLRIRNGIITRRLRWDEVGPIQYRHGDPWAYVVLAGTEDDPVRRQMLGIQSTDGQRARDSVVRLRELKDHWSPKG